MSARDLTQDLTERRFLDKGSIEKQGENGGGRTILFVCILEIRFSFLEKANLKKATKHSGRHDQSLQYYNSLIRKNYSQYNVF